MMKTLVKLYLDKKNNNNLKHPISQTSFSLSLQIEMDGLTGKIVFDTRGFRSDFTLDIIELKKDGMSKVGDDGWESWDA